MKSLTGNIALKLAVLIFAIFCAATIVRLQLKNNSIKDDVVELEKQIQAEEESNNELKNKIDEPFDEDYIIEIAKDKLNLRLPEEVIFYNDN